MATKAERLREIYESKIGKDLVDKLSDSQIKLISAFYNSLDNKEQSIIDSRIIMGYDDTDLHEMARGMVEEEDEEIPEGLDDLINEVAGKQTATQPKRKRGRPKKKTANPPPPPEGPSNPPPPPEGPGKLVLYKPPKDSKEDDLVSEEVDERILKMLGLEDVFDIDYGDYYNLLREKLIEVSKGDSDVSTEDAMLLQEEIKRVRDKKRQGDIGKVKLKKKKITTDSFIDFDVAKKTSQPTIKQKKDSDIPSGEDIAKKSQEISDKKEEYNNSIYESISKSLDNIIVILKDQLKFDKKISEKERKKKESAKRKSKEDKLESSFAKGIKAVSGMAKKVFSPLQDVIKRLITFFTAIFLGKVFQNLMGWFSDPKNESKVKTLGKLLKTFWPAILFGLLLFTNPLGKFVRVITGMILKWTFKLAKFAIPKLLRFARRNPKLAVAAGLFTAGATIPMLFPASVDAEERKTEAAPGTKEEKIQQLRQQKEGLNWFQKNVQGMGPEIDEQIQRLETGETASYSMGGPIASGNGINNTTGETASYSMGGPIASGHGYNGIDNTTGESITGAGPDTQLIAARPGEVVLTPEDQGYIYQNTGFDVAKYVGDRKPKFVKTSNLKFSNKGYYKGGMISTFKDGGIVGGNKFNLLKPQARIIFDRLVKGGLTKTAAAGIVANIGVETGYTYDPNTHQYEGGPGRGLVQWERGGRYDTDPINLRSFAESRKSSWNDLNTQIDFILHELNTHPEYKLVKKELNASKNIPTATRIFLEKYEKAGEPHIEDRLKVAKQIQDAGYLKPKPKPKPKTDPKLNRERLIQNRPWWDKFGWFGGRSAEIEREKTKSKNNLLKLYKAKGKEGGGIFPVTTRTGVDISGMGMAVQPGEKTKSKNNLLKLFIKDARKDPMIVADKLKGVYPSLPDGDQPNVNTPGYLDRYKESVEKYRNKTKGKEGGGIFPVTTRTGVDISGMGADTQYLPHYNMAVQPGEEIFKYVLTKDAAEKGAGNILLNFANNLNANFDSNSDAAKIGMRNKNISEGVRPYEVNSNETGGVSMLPMGGIGGPGKMPYSQNGGSTDSFHSPICEAGLSERQRILDIIGISAFE
jgi:hypothetical protein